ncbi:MAG: hypothetical protein ACEQSD_08905, partial [Flavobacteriales bacterium]
SAEAFQQSVEGAYYAKQFMQLYAKGRIGTLPDNSHLPVNTAWDIGVGDSTAIWFFRIVGTEYHVIDYYENSGEGLRHYMKVLKDRGYTYGQHFAPHDMDNREFGSDAQSRSDIARKGYEIDGQRYGIAFKVLKRAPVDEGIEAARELLAHCAFDVDKCEKGLSCLENYRKEWDDDKGSWKDRPLHDWSSHGADAFRYFAQAMSKPKPAFDTNLRMTL